MGDGVGVERVGRREGEEVGSSRVGMGVKPIMLALCGIPKGSLADPAEMHTFIARNSPGPGGPLWQGSLGDLFRKGAWGTSFRNSFKGLT